MHIPDAKRTKLEDKNFSCVLLGVSEESKAYRLYDPASMTIVLSRDVRFEEDKSWDWDKSYKELVAADLEWGDNEEDTALNGVNEEDSEGENDTGEVGTDSSNNVNEGSSSSSSEEGREERIRRRPVWMNYYESGEGLSEEEDVPNLVFFASTDPVHFEEAVKHEKFTVELKSKLLM